MAKTSRVRTHLSAVDRIGEYKAEIMRTMLADDDLTKLIYYSTPDCLFRESLTEEQRQGLLYTQIYPFRYVNEIIDEQTTFLSIGMNSFSPYDDRRVRDTHDYLTGQLLFHFFCHNQIMRTDSGVRQDLILGRLGHLFDRNIKIGMGEVMLHNTTELWLHNNRFGGYTAGFRVGDLR